MANYKMYFLGGVIVLLSVLTTTSSAQADDLCINYQGHMNVDNEAYTGTAQFKTAICDTDDNTIWSNDGSSVSCSEPTSGQDISVSEGIYSMKLGCEAGMDTIAASILGVSLNGPYKIKVWVKDSGADDYEVLSPVGFAWQ